MQTLPTTQNIRNARRQTEAAVKQLSTPVMAVIGAVDTATSTVSGLLGRANDRAQDDRERLAQALTDLQNRVSELPAEVRDLRDRLEPGELRKRTDAYADSAQRAYEDLARRGREVFGDFQRRPQVSRAVNGWESGVDAAQQRLEAVVTDLNSLADDLAARFARGSRSVGERTARATENAAEEVAEQVKTTGDEAAEAVTEAGEQAATTTRSGTRKAANRASAPRSSNTGSNTGSRGSTSSTSSRSSAAGKTGTKSNSTRQS